MQVGIVQRPFGRMPDGRQITAWILNRRNIEVTFLDWGCTLYSLKVPNRFGVPTDVVLGWYDAENGKKDTAWMGRTIGRVCNRIEGSSFLLNAQRYTLEANDGKNHLHGVFENRTFSANGVRDGVVFTYISPDGEEGYPGELTLEVVITLPADDTVEWTYIAKTNKDTPINITNHAYFNLSGYGNVRNHTLWLGAEHFCEVRSDCCPTGNILPVRGGAFDFTNPRALGSGLNCLDKQMRLVGGYDHNYILDAKDANGHAATLISPESGIQMKMYTSQPALQVYSGNWLHKNPAIGKTGMRFRRYEGIALEGQHFPCALNHGSFPSIILHEGEKYIEKTRLQFDVSRRSL